VELAEDWLEAAADLLFALPSAVRRVWCGKVSHRRATGSREPPWWAKGDLNPHPLAGTWPSTMRVCLFRHSPLFYALNLRNAVLSGCSRSIPAAEVATDSANGACGHWKQLSRKPFRISYWISHLSCGRELSLAGFTIGYGEFCGLPPRVPVRTFRPPGLWRRRPAAAGRVSTSIPAHLHRGRRRRVILPDSSKPGRVACRPSVLVRHH
jgi:hypothetical protein